MNISSRIGSYLSSPIGIKSNTYDDSNFETSIFKKTLLTNAAIIVGASLIGLKARSLPKDIFIQAKKEPIVKNNFSQLIERSKTFFEKLNPKVVQKLDKPVQVELPNIKKQMFDPTIPGSKLSDEERLSRIFVKLKDVWTNDGKVLPEKIDEILTNHVGKNRVREIRFYTDEKRGILFGRKKSYRMKSGNIFVLETHNARNGELETRCYWAIGSDRKPLTKDNRLYLSPDGIFEPDQYFSRKAHLPSSLSAIQWVNEAKRGG